MSGSKDDADTAPSDVAKPTADKAHTGQGAPTDEAPQDAGDGSLTGSTPAGLTVDELLEQANSGKPVDGGTDHPPLWWLSRTLRGGRRPPGTDNSLKA